MGAAAAVIGLLAFQVHRLDNRVNNLAQTSPDNGLSQAATAAALNPQAQRVNLRPLSACQTCQLWAVTATRQLSLGVLGANPKNAAFSLGSPNPRSMLVVTVEPSGGVQSTSNPAVVAGSL